jgi:class 3 adenylate cyclase
VKRKSEPVVLTVLFTDLVSSTERAGQLGDSHWQVLLAEHDALVRRQLDVFNGREVKTTGDGFLAVFDSASRAVRCTAAIRAGLENLDLKMRAGLHTGECVVKGRDVAGVAVHIASRVETAARPGEILVSSTVRDVLAGSGVRLADQGMHTLKGLDEQWRLYSVEPA